MAEKKNRGGAPKGNKNAVGNEGGRPEEYKPEYCEQLIQYFDEPPYDEVEIPHYKDNEITWIDKKRVANPFPKFHVFAKKIGVTHQTLLNWTKEHIEFFEAYTQAKELQKYFIIENGLNYCYNAAFAIFTAKNITDMRDNHELTGKDGSDLFPPARTLTKEEAREYLQSLEKDV